MGKGVMPIRHILTLLCLSALTPMAAAQAQPANSGNNDLLATLYNQMQALQQDVQNLRGQVEEQGYQLKRMQSDQKDRYLDIDRRLSALSPAAPTAGSSLPTTGDKQPSPPPSLDASSAANNSAATVVTVPAPPADPLVSGQKKAGVSDVDDKELYRTALNLLLQENKPDDAILKFQAYIDTFPQGKLFTNALYWQGEAYLLVSGFTKARDVFLRLLTEYPADAKAAGAMLKLGMAYKQMGETANAADTWKQLKTRFPENPNEIRLSEEYLKDLKPK